MYSPHSGFYICCYPFQTDNERYVYGNKHQIFCLEATYNYKHTRPLSQLTLTNVRLIQALAKRAKVARFASIAVDTLGVVSTVLAHTASFVVTVDVQREVLPVHFRIVRALISVSKTIASCKQSYHEACALVSQYTGLRRHTNMIIML
jgi:hypothetical protein